MIASLLFADDVIVLAPLSEDLQCLLGRFSAESEAGRSLSLEGPQLGGASAGSTA